MHLCNDISRKPNIHPMKKPILIGLGLVICALSYSQVSNSTNTLSPSILYNSLQQYSQSGKNLNAQLALQSLYSTIPGHPVFGELGVSYIPDWDKSTKPEASLSVFSGSYGPFSHMLFNASLGIINSADREGFGYRGGVKAGYNNIRLDGTKLVWSDPDFEPAVYEQTGAFNISYYLGGWMKLGSSSNKSVLSFSFESIPLLKQGSESGVYPYLGRYALTYYKQLDEAAFNVLYQLDLDILRRPVHLGSINYYFPFPIHVGILASNTGFAGLSAGYIWHLNDFWDTTIDINYRYIGSFGEYTSAVGSTHQIMVKCSSHL